MTPYAVLLGFHDAVCSLMISNKLLSFTEIKLFTDGCYLGNEVLQLRTFRAKEAEYKWTLYI